MKTTTFAICLMATLMTVKPAMAKSGNGESYSGPTLAPQAVAISVDKPILSSQFQKMALSCFFEGGENSFAKQFISPLFPKHQVIDASLYEGFDAYDVNGSLVLSVGYVTLKNIGTNDRDEDRFLGFEIIENGSLIISDAYSSNYKTPRKFEIRPFPIFKAKTKKVDIFHPISGDFQKTETMLENLQVIYDFRNSSPYVKATNITVPSKKAPTQLSAPVGDFVNCLVEKLGKI